jgi:hypothetical protein
LSGCADLTEFKNDSAPTELVDADEKVKLVSENMTISAQTLRVFNSIILFKIPLRVRLGS